MARDSAISICDKIILFSIYTIAYFLPISKAIIEVLSTLAIICFIVKKILEHKFISKNNINYAIFVYLLISLLSIFISSNFKISARTFIGKILQDTLFFFVISDTLNSKSRIKNTVYILLMSSLLLGIDGVYQYFTHKDFIRHRKFFEIPRIHATFPSANDYGCYLATVIPFTLACFFDKLSFKKSFRFLFSGLLILLFVCLMLTVSRGAWFAFIGAILFMSIWIRSLGVFFLILGIVVILANQFYYPILKVRVTNLFIFEDHSSLDRMRIWEAAWKMFMTRPIVGLGLGTFMFNFSRFVVKDYLYTAPYAHNCYLQIASELGIIGLVSFLSILVLFFSHGIEIISYERKTSSWYILLASLASLLGYSLQMTVDTIFYSLDLGILFWIILGLGVAAMNNIRLEGSKA